MSATRPQPRGFASLSSSLLARKGSARPAMRSSGSEPGEGVSTHAPLHPASLAVADDLGWNDYGPEADAAPVPAPVPALVTPIQPALPAGKVLGIEPAVVRQRIALAARLARPAPAPAPEPAAPEPASVAAPVAPVIAAAPRGTAAGKGRRAAFTLRLDSERHMHLRLASAVAGISAQRLLTEALDRLIATDPRIRALVGQVASPTADPVEE